MSDWALKSRGTLDLLLAGAGALLVALALLMIVTDYAHEVDSTRALTAFGETTAFDPSYRLAFVPWLLGLVTFFSIGLVVRWVTLRRDPRLARHARRSMTLLFAGSALADFTYYADTTFGLDAPHAVRALAIDPAYAVAGVLVAGAAWRIRSLVRPLPPLEPGA